MYDLYVTTDGIDTTDNFLILRTFMRKYSTTKLILFLNVCHSKIRSHCCKKRQGGRGGEKRYLHFGGKMRDKMQRVVYETNVMVYFKPGE